MKKKSKSKGSSEKERFLKGLGKTYSKELTARATSWELDFKAKLEQTGVKFIFQHPVVCEKNYLYILDFYLPDHGLVFELDGAHHYQKDKIRSDNQRTKRLEVLGFKVKRLMNKDIKIVTPQMIEVYIQKHALKS